VHSITEKKGTLASILAEILALNNTEKRNAILGIGDAPSGSVAAAASELPDFITPVIFLHSQVLSFKGEELVLKEEQVREQAGNNTEFTFNNSSFNDSTAAMDEFLAFDDTKPQYREVVAELKREQEELERAQVELRRAQDPDYHSNSSANESMQNATANSSNSSVNDTLIDPANASTHEEEHHEEEHYVGMKRGGGHEEEHYVGERDGVERGGEHHEEEHHEEEHYVGERDGVERDGGEHHEEEHHEEDTRPSSPPPALSSSLYAHKQLRVDRPLVGGSDSKFSFLAAAGGGQGRSQVHEVQGFRRRANITVPVTTILNAIDKRMQGLIDTASNISQKTVGEWQKTIAALQNEPNFQPWENYAARENLPRWPQDPLGGYIAGGNSNEFPRLLSLVPQSDGVKYERFFGFPLLLYPRTYMYITVIALLVVLFVYSLMKMQMAPPSGESSTGRNQVDIIWGGIFTLILFSLFYLR